MNNDAELVRGWKDSGLSRKKYAESLGISDSTIANAAERLKKTRTAEGLFSVDIGEPLKLSGDWMIVGDIHVPTTDYDLACKVAKVAKLRHVTKLLIAGDLFNFDLFSKYPRILNGPGWREEKAAAKFLLKEWTDFFQSVVILPGNHDRRMTKWSGGEILAEDIFGIVTDSPKVTTSNFGWCTIETKTGTWRVTHPGDYSKIPLRKANALASKFQQHVISFHEHHLGFSFDDSGKFALVNGGGLFDDSKMAYVQLDDNASPTMQRGFVSLIDGYPTLYGKSPITNWDAMK